MTQYGNHVLLIVLQLVSNMAVVLKLCDKGYFANDQRGNTFSVMHGFGVGMVKQSTCAWMCSLFKPCINSSKHNKSAKKSYNFGMQCMVVTT